MFYVKYLKFALEAVVLDHMTDGTVMLALPRYPSYWILYAGSFLLCEFFFFFYVQKTVPSESSFNALPCIYVDMCMVKTKYI